MGVLRPLLPSADIVIEASRPRAFAQLGLEPQPHHTWVSITGYGRTGPWCNRTAFGDDAAAAGGLVAMADGAPVFCADAIADPLAGIWAAVAALDAYLHGGGVIIDVALREAAGHAMATVPSRPKSDTAAPSTITVQRPRARTPLAPAPALGAHTEAVVKELAGRR